MSLDRFSIEEKLGAGAYATVYKVKRLEDGNDFALKKVKLMSLNEKERENSLNEVRLLASIRDQNVISYKECFWDNNTASLCLVMEYADDGDLFEKIRVHQQNKTSFKEEEIWDIFIHIVFGLKALHDLNINHRDLKTANVFLFKDGTAKLGDFNVSKIAKDGFLKTQTGTPYYASPEVWKDVGYDQKSDIWSLGCILYEMACLKPPFHSENLEGLSKKVIKGVYPKLPSSYSEEFVKMVAELLQVEAEKRPDCDGILGKESVVSRLKERHLYELDEEKPEMMKTIKCPKNLKNLHLLVERLPPINYEPLKTKKIDEKTFQEKLLKESRSPKPEKVQIEVHHDYTSFQSNPNTSLPKIKETVEESNLILSRNNDLLIAKQPGNRVKYISYLKKPIIKTKKSVSPPRPKYGNQKMGRNFLLEPLNLKKSEDEDGRKLFSKQICLKKEEDEEYHDYFHPKFDQNISLVQKIYGYNKNEKRQVTPLKVVARTEKKFLPMISSENRKFDKSPIILKTDESERERHLEKLSKIKEIMKAYQIDGKINQSEIQRMLKVKS